MQFSGKNKYKRKTFVEKAKSFGDNVASSRGAKQVIATTAIVTDLATGANISRQPFRLAGFTAGKMAAGAGHIKRGAGSFKNTLTSAYQKAIKGPSKPVGTNTYKKPVGPKRPLRITAGTKPLRLYGTQIGTGLNPKTIVTPAPKPGAVKPSGSIPNRLVNQSTGRPFPKESIAGGKPGTKSIRTIRMPLVRGAETYTRAAIMSKGSGPGSPLPKSGMIAIANENKRVGALNSSIKKTKDASIKKTKKLSSSAPPKSNIATSANARDKIAAKIKNVRKTSSDIVAKKTKKIGTKPKTTVVKPKVTPKSPGVVYNASSKMKPKVKMNPKGGKNILNPAGAAVSMVHSMGIERSPEKYQKGIFGGTVGKTSPYGYLANTNRGKAATIKVSNIKSNIKSKITKVKKRFKF